MFVASLCNLMEFRVLFFPLQRFLIHDRLPNAIGTYLTNTGAFTRNPLDRQNFATPDQRLILVFDGLDELTKPGDLAETEVRRFLAELRMTLGQWNQDGC